MRVTLLTIVCLVLLPAGCVKVHEVEVLSDPPGARIEVDGDYVGDAPLTIRMRAEGGRVFETCTVRALPVKAGQWAQTKVFDAYAGDAYGFYVRGQPVPKRIFFDMHLRPAADVQVDVNVDTNRE